MSVRWDGREWTDFDRFAGALDANSDGSFAIEYGTVPAKSGKGFLPATWTGNDPRESVVAWSFGGFDRDSALEIAEREARRSAEKFIGDWSIVVRPRAGAVTR